MSKKVSKRSSCHATGLNGAGGSSHRQVELLVGPARKNSESSDYLKIESKEVQKAIDEAGAVKDHPELAQTGTFPQQASPMDQGINGKESSQLRESVQKAIEKTRAGNYSNLQQNPSPNKDGRLKNGIHSASSHAINE